MGLKQRAVILALGATVVLWASAFSAIRSALASYGPAHLSLLRVAIAAAALLAIAWMRQMRLPARRDLPRILAVGLFGMTLYQLLLNVGETIVDAGTASMILAGVPVIAAVLAHVTLRESLGLRGWIGVAIALIGALVMSLNGRVRIELNSHALLILGAAVSQALFFVIQKPLLERYSPLEVTTYSMAAGALLLLPASPQLISAVADATTESTLSVIWLGIGASAAGFVCWARVLKSTDVARAAVALYLIPPVAIAIAWMWRSEIPPTGSLIGGVLVLAGVAVANGA